MNEFTLKKNTLKEYNNSAISIKSWQECDRPREKFMQQGKKSLSNSELLAIIIGSGHQRYSALDLSRQILDDFHQNLEKISRCSPLQLTRFKGMGKVKAITILAAIELGKRCAVQLPEPKKFIHGSTDVYEHIGPLLMDLPHEEFHVILTSRSNAIITTQKISSGGINGTIVDPRIIFKLAIENSASGIILIHNHPSGQLKPSRADRSITKKLVEAGRFLDINVNDHLIIGDQGYFSFRDEDLID